MAAWSWITGTVGKNGYKVPAPPLSPLHEVFTAGPQAKKTTPHVLAVKLELGLEFQCCRTISVCNPRSQLWAVFAQVGLGKMQMAIFLPSNGNLHLTHNCENQQLGEEPFPFT